MDEGRKMNVRRETSIGGQQFPFGGRVYFVTDRISGTVPKNCIIRN